ncbi:hypothetical protein NDU88_004776 [Pleurodeles waltl]|uniref:Uncharacterized protein n=1 Tax=Pleurodeles waltl TaxID=8319 RepID=A0AAV7MB07_PLEWA|nr:hypothetical protein NDU88_004776 [Pleurodeles waltl]
MTQATRRSALQSQQGTSAGSQAGSSRQPRARSGRRSLSQRARPRALHQHKARLATNLASDPTAGAPQLHIHRRAVSVAASTVRLRQRAAWALASQHPPHGGRTTTGRNRPLIQAGRPARQSRVLTSPGSHRGRSTWCRRELRSDPTADLAPRVRLPTSSKRRHHNRRHRAPHLADQPGQKSPRRHVPSRPVQPRPGPPPRMFARRRPGPYLPPQRLAAPAPLQCRQAGKA